MNLLLGYESQYHQPYMNQENHRPPIPTAQEDIPPLAADLGSAPVAPAEPAVAPAVDPAPAEATGSDARRMEVGAMGIFKGLLRSEPFQLVTSIIGLIMIDT